MDNKKIEENKELFITLLKGTGRKGIDKVIEGIEKLGFFKAPASAKHHLAEEGGLLQHSLNVYAQAVQIRAAQTEIDPDISRIVWPENIVIAALLHDVCKADAYKQVEKFRKDEKGKWEKYLSYENDQSNCPLGHGEKSVIRLLLMGLELTESEICAIRWHMGKWDLSEYNDSRKGFDIAGDKYPLLPIIMSADLLASRITEKLQ